MKGSSSAGLPAINETRALVANPCGSSSAGLPAINETRALVANPCANPKPKKKNKEKGKNSKCKKETKIISPQDQCDVDILAKREIISSSKINKMGTKLQLNVYIPDGKIDNLEQKKMAEMEAFFRRKKETHMGNNPNWVKSITSLQKRRQASAKSRDHLLSLMPSRESPNMYVNEDLVVSAKRELEIIRRHTNRLVGRQDSSELYSLYQKSVKASKLREMIFGKRDQTNNCVGSNHHVTEKDCRRSDVLAPISKCTKNKEIKTKFIEKNKTNESRYKDRKHVSLTY